MESIERMAYLENRRRYFDLEKKRQAIANADVLDEKAFLSLYGVNAFDLYPPEKVNIKFYEAPQSNPNLEPKEEWRLAQIFSMIPEDSQAKVLNAGSGWKGIFAWMASDLRPELKITAVDQLPERCYKGPSTTAYYQCDVADMRICCLDNHFEIIVCMETLEHISPTRIMDVWKEFYRVLKPKGEILLTVPYTETLENFIMRCPICNEDVIESGHLRYYPPSVVTAEMVVNGFKCVERRTLDGSVRAYKGVKL